MGATAKPRMAIAAPHKNNVFISDKKFRLALMRAGKNESLGLFAADVELFERKGRISRMHSHSYRRLLLILRLHSGKLLRQTANVLVGHAGDQRLRRRSSGGLYPTYCCRGSGVGLSPGEIEKGATLGRNGCFKRCVDVAATAGATVRRGECLGLRADS
jgi:hypothetical protein